MERDLRGVPGVLGGVTPFPLAREAPITFTSSFTETPCSSGGISLLIRYDALRNSTGVPLPKEDFLLSGGLAEPPPPPLLLLRPPPAARPAASPLSDLNHFWKNDLRSSVPERPREMAAGGGEEEPALTPKPPPPATAP